MAGCHNYTTLLDMKAGHHIPSPLPSLCLSLSHSHPHSQPPHFSPQMLTGQLQTLCDKLRTLQKSKACRVTQWPTDCGKAVSPRLDGLHFLFSVQLMWVAAINVNMYTNLRFQFNFDHEPPNSRFTFTSRGTLHLIKFKTFKYFERETQQFPQCEEKNGGDGEMEERIKRWGSGRERRERISALNAASS